MIFNIIHNTWELWDGENSSLNKSSSNIDKLVFKSNTYKHVVTHVTKLVHLIENSSMNRNMLL